MLTIGVAWAEASAARPAAKSPLRRLVPDDIGQPAQLGSSSNVAPGTIEVKAGGYDTWFNSDSFHYVHQERTGDFDVRVRVASFGPTGVHISAKAALMVRESLAAPSRHVTITVYPSAKNWTAYRRETSGGPSTTLDGNWRVNWPAGKTFPNVWLRIKREGNALSTFGSDDGQNWIQIGNTCVPSPAFPPTVHLGLATTSVGEQFSGSPMASVLYEQFGDFAITNAQITFVQQPTNTVAIENTPVCFTACAKVIGTVPSNLSYQWFKNGEAIPGATTAAYTIPAVTTIENGARYHLRVSVAGGKSASSQEAILAVEPDLDPPKISSIAALKNGSIGIRFSELVRAGGVASAASHYRLDDGAPITKATLMPDDRTVLLTTPGLKPGNHHLAVHGITDLAGNAVNTTVQFTLLDWSAENIGIVADDGFVCACSPDEITVRASGADIWKTADSFNFVHQPRTGDFDICVQLGQLDHVTPSTRGGLMVRETLMPDSRNFFAGTYAAGGSDRWVATVRQEARGNTTLAPGDSFVARGSDFAYPNAWIRLKRVADTFTAYYGTNGLNWVQLGDQFTPATSYPATVHVGFATASIVSTPGRLTTAQYRNFTNWAAPAGRAGVSSRTESVVFPQADAHIDLLPNEQPETNLGSELSTSTKKSGY